MFKPSQKIFSAISIAFLFVFLFITPKAATACEEAPQTLLSLYLTSDLIILADIDSSTIVKTEDESEYGTWMEVKRNLRIVKILKGQPGLEKVEFTNGEFHANPNAPKYEDEEMLEMSHPYEDLYVDISKVKVGDRYLFFLTKNEETKGFELSDYRSGIKDVHGKMNIYEESIAELKAISNAKENQLDMLAEWLVKSIEEPETRQDALSDLSESFYAIEYAEETAEAVKDGEKKPFAFDKTFYIYESGVAKRLTDSQKSRVSGALYPMLQEAWFAKKPTYAHYGIVAILGSFERSRLAVYSYNMLKSIDENDLERKQIVMSFIADVVNDKNLREIYYEFSDVVNKSRSKEAKTPESLKAQNVLKTDLLKKFDKRFGFVLYRNFKPEPAKG